MFAEIKKGCIFVSDKQLSISLKNNKMTNTTAQIEIKEVLATETVKGTTLIVKEQPVIGGGINETKEENTIYHTSIVYEF